MTLGRSSSADSDMTDPFDRVFAVVVEECYQQIEKIINLNPKKKKTSLMRKQFSTFPFRRIKEKKKTSLMHQQMTTLV